MKPNTSWEVRAPAFSPGRKSIHVITPRNPKMTAFNNLPLVFTDGPFGDKDKQQKQQEEHEGSLFYSSFSGQKSYSSFTSVATEQSARDSSRKSTHSSRDLPKKIRRRARRRSSTVGTTVAFDPTRVPLKCCTKRTSQSPTEELQPRPKRGESYKVYLPGNAGCIRRKRTIQFNDGVHIREVRSSLSLCKGEHRLLWWQDDEHASIKENLLRLLSRVNSKGVSKTNGRRYCTRGLERFLDTKHDWDADRAEAEKAVYREQTHQREMGTFDDLRIAAVYFRRTRASMQRASSRGIEDAIVALPILNEGKVPSKMHSSTSMGSLNASIGMSPSNPKPRRSSLSMLPRRGSLSFRRKPEEQRLKKSQSFRHIRPIESSVA